jgi:D-alanyl-D-alanine carboxypeptidase
MPFEPDDNKISRALDALGITAALIAQLPMPFYPEARELVIAEADDGGKEYLLIPEAAKAWAEMKQAALQDQVVIEIVSAFRDIERQSAIIRAKLERGMPFEKIFTLSAPPGYSEHHTGRAIDINTPGCRATEEEFEDTEAFRWLSAHAAKFGFALSYPRGNTVGFIYEPWHWCFRASPA